MLWAPKQKHFISRECTNSEVPNTHYIVENGITYFNEILLMDWIWDEELTSFDINKNDENTRGHS